jgi:HSP20 family protein
VFILYQFGLVPTKGENKMSVFGLVKSYDMINNMQNMIENSYNYGFVPSKTYSATVGITNNAWFTHARVNKSDESYEIIVELPGLSRSDIDVNVFGKTLTVSANRELRNGNSQYKEEYKNSWALPDHTSFDLVNARYEAGVLIVTIPLKKEYSRKIEIE